VPRAPKTEGYFYAVQVVPELAPQWVKFGRTNNVTRRLKEHRTVAPTALLLAPGQLTGVMKWQRS